MAAPHRLVALSIVYAVLHKATAPEQALASHPDTKRLEARDRAFAYAIAVATIRRIGAIDHVLDVMLEKDLPDQAIRARNILRCAVAELLILKTPPHAVVNSWTSIMGGDRSSAKFRGLCNAVLRRVSREGLDHFNQVDPLLDLPEWIGRRWVRTYGEDIARSIACARQDQPPLDLTFKPDADLPTWSKTLDARILPTQSLRLSDRTEVTGLAGYEDGIWWVQDAAAALAVRLLKPAQGELIVDLCAAPGGKTLQIAASGARTIALDRSAKRLQTLKDNLSRTGLNADVVCDDAETWQPDDHPDAILLDAPCSATGTIRRHPETVWIKSEDDIQRLASLQTRLLDHSLDMLKPGGRLVYCTCSLEPEEGEDQIRSLIQRRDDIAIDPVRPEEMSGLETAIRSEGWVRTRPDMWQDMGGMDGFFIARLIKS